MFDDDKRLAAEAAVAEIESGMLVGLGTGTTAAHAIAAIGARVKAGLAIDAVATSQASEQLAVRHGIELLDFEDVAHVDLAIDGADEIDARLRAIKGAGGAMLREKIIASSARRMIVIADGSKCVAHLGTARLPVEVLPFARSFVASKLVAFGAAVELRMAGSEPYRTDQANLILDCSLVVPDMPEALASSLSAIPGVLGHGLFVTEVDAAYIAFNGQVDRIERE